MPLSLFIYSLVLTRSFPQWFFNTAVHGAEHRRAFQHLWPPKANKLSLSLTWRVSHVLSLFPLSPFRVWRRTTVLPRKTGSLVQAQTALFAEWFWQAAQYTSHCWGQIHCAIAYTSEQRHRNVSLIHIQRRRRTGHTQPISCTCQYQVCCFSPHKHNHTRGQVFHPFPNGSQPIQLHRTSLQGHTDYLEHGRMMLQICMFGHERHGCQRLDIRGVRVGMAVLQTTGGNGSTDTFERGWWDPLVRDWHRVTLGAEGVLPGRHIVSLLRVFEQFTHLIPSG